jgi:hypothetical protein
MKNKIKTISELENKLLVDSKPDDIKPFGNNDNPEQNPDKLLSAEH